MPSCVTLFNFRIYRTQSQESQVAENANQIGLRIKNHERRNEHGTQFEEEDFPADSLFFSAHSMIHKPPPHNRDFI